MTRRSGICSTYRVSCDASSPRLGVESPRRCCVRPIGWRENVRLVWVNFQSHYFGTPYEVCHHLFEPVQGTG